VGGSYGPERDLRRLIFQRRLIMKAAEKIEFLSQVIGSVKGELVLGEGAKEGFHAILMEASDELTRLRRATEERAGRE
jgi:hypothetical protein